MSWVGLYTGRQTFFFSLSVKIQGDYYNFHTDESEWGKAMANYLQELAQDAVCQSHTGHMSGLWFLPSPAFKAEY